MAFKIILYLLLLTVGGLLSFKNLVNEKLFKKITNIQLFFLYMLIFIMGIRLGMDDKVMKSIGNIGVKSLVFAILTVVFSVGVLFFVSKYIIKDKRIEGKE